MMPQLLKKQRQEDGKAYQRMLGIELSRSPSLPLGSLVAHQPTFMEQLHSSPPLLDPSALSTPRLSEVGTSYHPAAVGDNRLDGSGGQFSS